MSELHFSLEQMARLQEASRALALQAAGQARDLQTLLADAELELRHGLPEQRSRQRAAVTAARQLCLGAREHQVEIDQLMIDLGAEPAVDRRLPPIVLVADDQPGIRQWLFTVLHDAGFLVQTAANGIEAVIAAHQLRPAVILMDIRMPILDGIEATRLIKALDELRAVHVIAHTAERLAAADSSAPSGLFAAVLPKPSRADQILTTVRRCAHLPA